MGMYRGLKQSTTVRKQVNQLGNGQPQSGNCQPIWKQVNHNQKTSQPQSENKSSTVRKHSINQETVNQSEKQTTVNQSGTKSIIAWKQSATEETVNQPEKQSTTVSHSQETVNQSGNKSTTVKNQSAKQETVNQSEEKEKNERKKNPSQPQSGNKSATHLSSTLSKDASFSQTTIRSWGEA